MNKIISILAISLILFSCKTTKNSSQKTNKLESYSVEQTIIYKTIRDFSHLVPVTMNEARTQIVSYPAPSDLLYNGKILAPTLLTKEYLLDNRGINANVAFTSYTYEEYAALKEVPSLQTLLTKIVEKYPLTELYYCGPRNQYNSVSSLNKLIENGFSKCKKADLTVMQVSF